MTRPISRRSLCRGLALLPVGAAFVAQPARAFFERDAYDVIVVGAGGAGLAAALTAAEGGASVLLIEKMPAIGGNTLRASGLFNAADPERQRPMGIEDSPEWHYEQMMASGRHKATPEVVRRFVTEALPTLHWLESLGVRFLPSTVTTWGAEWPRGHKPLQPRGQAYIRVLSAECIRRGVRIRTRLAMTRLVIENGRVCGIEARDLSPEGGNAILRLRARRAVVLAAGGFGANAKLVAEHRPDLRNIPSDNNPGNTGEVMLEALRAGAASTGLAYIQCVPGAPFGRPFQVRLDLDAGRIVMVDARGRRFVDEDQSRDVLAQTVLNHPIGSVFMITDNASVNAMDLVSRKDVYRGLQTKDAVRADTLEALASATGIPPGALRASVEAFNREVGQRTGKCGRITCRPIAEPPFWASRVILNVHTTMGGLVITPDAQVLDKAGRIIPGLLAAGEITGNVHGENRIGGNGIADAVTFGRIAGQTALKTPRG